MTLGFGREKVGGGWSEFFRAEHGDDEIDEGGEGDQADEEVFHDDKSRMISRVRPGIFGRIQRTFLQK